MTLKRTLELGAACITCTVSYFILINYYYSQFVFSLLLPWGASISQFKPVVKCLIYFRYLFLCIFEIITGLYSCSQWLAIFDNEQLFLHTRLVAQEYSAGFCMVVTLIPLAPAEMLPFRPSYTTTEKHHYFIKPSAVIALNIPKWTILTYFYSEFHLTVAQYRTNNDAKRKKKFSANHKLNVNDIVNI